MTKTLGSLKTDATTAKLSVGGKEVELPVVVGTENERAVDIAQLLKLTGHITLDEGYANTGATTSSITYLDGDAGILRYRGYPIEVLAEHCDFVETCYLLIYGELPNREQLESFREAIRRHTMLHEDMRSFYNGFPRDAHPMAILSSVVGALSTFYQDSLDVHDPEQVTKSIHRLLAKLPTIAAYSYKKSFGQPFNYPLNSLDYCENFLHMMFSVPSESYEPDPDFVRALNLLFIVHADHEQNCSTSTVRMVGSSNANLFASISAGICALWGPLHGGANEACVNMLQGIANDGGNVKKYVDMAKDKSSNFRLMDLVIESTRTMTLARRSSKQLRQTSLENSSRRSIVRCRSAIGRSGSQGSLLRRTKALSERRFLLGDYLSSHGNSRSDVHGIVCDRSSPRLDCTLGRDAP